MGKGSNDPILNRLMPRKAMLNAPDAYAVALSQPCRNDDELLACKNIVRSIDDLLEQIVPLRRNLKAAKALIEAKIKAYEEEL